MHILDSIRGRILSASLIPLFLCLSLACALLLSRHITYTQEVALERSLALARQTASLAELPVATFTTEAAQQVVTFIRQAPNVDAVALLDGRGRTLAAAGELSAITERLLAARPLNEQIERTKELISIVLPISIANLEATAQRQQVGLAALQIRREGEHILIRRILWGGISITLFVLAAAYALTHWATQSLTHSLSLLSQRMREVAQGNLSVQLSWSEHGELKQLSDHFNAMTSSLARARSQLQAEIDKATSKLAERTREAEAANLAKSRFLAAASHDLRQSAHALSLYIASLRNMSSSLSAETHTLIGPAINGAHAASRSIDDLLNRVLDISRFDAGLVPVDPRRVDLSVLLRDAVLLAEPTAREKGLRITARAKACFVAVDPQLFRRILDNLIANAVRHCYRGRILVSLRRRAHDALVQVWDQGEGIAAEHLPHIFEEFYRVRRSTGNRVSGMGLGLSIAVRAAELLGAKLTVRSVPGHGSCFTITLPGALGMSGHPPELDTQSRVHTVARGGIIIVLDDDPMVRDSTSRYLGQLGYTVVASAWMEEISPVIESRSSEIAAVFVDYQLMYRNTGLSIAVHLRRQLARLGSTAPVIMITGDTSTERLRELRQSGFEVMHKPINPKQLLERLGRT